MGHGSSKGPRQRKQYPLPALIVLGIVLVAVCGFTAVRAAEQHGDVARSQRTQDDGVRVSATITSTRTVQYRTKGGTSYDSLWTVRLAEPVDGRRTTVVHLPGRSAPPTGERREIVVDPRDAGYAEPVGTPLRTTFDWAGTAIIAVVLGLAALVVGVVVVRRVTRR